MTHKLEIDDVAVCKHRMECCEKALDDVKGAAFGLRVAGARRAHARVVSCKKSVMGARNNARSRYLRAKRKAEQGCAKFYEGSLGRCVHCDKQKSAHAHMPA